MDAKYYMGDDDRDSLTHRPGAKAKLAPTCTGCGFVVYKVGARVLGGVLCQPCAEAQKVEAA